MSADYSIVYDGNRFTLDGTFHPDATRVFDIKADMLFEKDGEAYSLTGNVDVDGPVLSESEGKLSVVIDADIRAGDGLGTLKDSSSWQDVYAETWSRLNGSWEDLIIPQG
jgi:hypothetical protein